MISTKGFWTSVWWYCLSRMIATTREDSAAYAFSLLDRGKKEASFLSYSCAFPEDDRALSDMTRSELKDELESYGISSASFFDRASLREALQKARQDRSQSTPHQEEGKTDATCDQYEALVQEGNQMTTSELKKALQAEGIGTDAFFDKDEMVKAYAKANLQTKTEDNYHDPSYRDVTTRKFDPSYSLFGTNEVIIDVTDDSSSNPTQDVVP